MPIEKVVAIGDSFFAGNELRSKLTWPFLYSKYRDLDYVCLAKAGHGTQFVLRSLLESLAVESKPCFYIILWPSALRFEYVNRANDEWTQINPNAVLPESTAGREVQEFYYKNINSLLGDKWQTLWCMWSAINALQNHKFVMTTTNDFLFDTQFHNPLYVKYLQDQVKPALHWFDDMTFIDWAKKNNFAHGPFGHPLEHAHLSAFEHVKTYYDSILDIA